MTAKADILNQLNSTLRQHFANNARLSRLLREAMRSKDLRYIKTEYDGSASICFANRSGIQVVRVFKDGRHTHTRNNARTPAGRTYCFVRMYTPENEIVSKWVRVYPKRGDSLPYQSVTAKHQIGDRSEKLLFENEYILSKRTALEKSFTTP